MKSQCWPFTESFTEQYSPVVLFIVFYTVVLQVASESVNKTLKWDCWIESYCLVFSCGVILFIILIYKVV